MIDNIEKIQKTLKNLGFTETESKIYITGLAYDAIGVTKLSKLTGIQRTTIYHAIETLEQKGLISKRVQSGKLNFSMVSPEELESVLNQKIADLERCRPEIKEIMPFLSQKVPAGENARIYQFEGIQGIKTVVEEALYCKSRTWDIIAPAKNFFSEFDKQYARYYSQQRKLNGIKSRTLWESKPGSTMSLSSEERKQRNPRILPKAMHGRFSSVVIIFDDKVALISSLVERSAVIIKSKDFSQTIGTMFEGLWSVSSEYQG